MTSLAGAVTMPTQATITQELKAGTLFEAGGRTYRLNSFFCEASDTVPDSAVLAELFAEWDEQDKAELPEGMRRIKLNYCLPEQATYVSGSGVAGCVEAISEIEVVGMVAWSAKVLSDHHEAALRKGRQGGYAVTLIRPIVESEHP